MNRSLFFVLTLAGTVPMAVAQEAPGRINLSDPNLLVVDSSVIPIPLEIFASLDKIGNQDWTKQVEEEPIRILLRIGLTGL